MPYCSISAGMPTGAANAISPIPISAPPGRPLGRARRQAGRRRLRQRRRQGRSERPAHSRLLKNEILIVEDLRGLEALHGKAFRFFAMPLPVRGAASMPVRSSRRFCRERRAATRSTHCRLRSSGLRTGRRAERVGVRPDNRRQRLRPLDNALHGRRRVPGARCARRPRAASSQSPRRRKKLADLCFLLNIEDSHTVTYTLRKLTRIGLIAGEKSGKEMLYNTTAEGEAACERYRQVREDCLISALEAFSPPVSRSSTSRPARPRVCCGRSPVSTIRPRDPRPRSSGRRERYPVKDGNVVVVLDVVRQIMHLDAAEAGVTEVALGRLSATWRRDLRRPAPAIRSCSACRRSCRATCRAGGRGLRDGGSSPAISCAR